MKLPSIFDAEVDLEKNKTLEVIRRDDDTLLLNDKISESELIIRNILYQKRKDNKYRKTTVIADVSKDWNFQIITSEYDVLNDKYGLVETEREISFITFLENDIKNIPIFPLDKNIFNVLKMIKESNIKCIESKKEGYFRQPHEHGLDIVWTSDGNFHKVSYFMVDLDLVVKENSKNIR